MHVTFEDKNGDKATINLVECETASISREEMNSLKELAPSGYYKVTKVGRTVLKIQKMVQARLDALREDLKTTTREQEYKDLLYFKSLEAEAILYLIVNGE